MQGRCIYSVTCKPHCNRHRLQQKPLQEMQHTPSKLHNSSRLQPTFPGTSLTQLNLIWRCMGPEIQVGKHKETTVTVVVLAWHVSSLARHGTGLKVMCDTWVLLHPPHWHRGGVLLIQLALPLHIQICPDGLTDHRQVMAAACTCRRMQCQL